MFVSVCHVRQLFFYVCKHEHSHPMQGLVDISLGTEACKKMLRVIEDLIYSNDPRSAEVPCDFEMGCFQDRVSVCLVILCLRTYKLH